MNQPLSAVLLAVLAAPTLPPPRPAEPPAFPAPQNLNFAKCKAKANRLN
ncbi:hypothetical protein [Kingella bonacorsii]|uniref:Uncharacterized protein n=1 Tax=Kingella bonacorsii TaxID=2796361 RepID=A0ABS1BRV7_9NEIS|nr:hypothetical protein [Kingella bonacorsii]MBK0395962.1 hypothetical protein [Kingella bonacorsii]